MLPVKYRIKKEFLPLTLKQSKVFPSPDFSLRVHFRSLNETNFNKPAKLAIIVSKKVSPLSVTRHLIKRRISTVLEKIWPSIPDNLDIIIQAQRDLSQLSFPDLDKKLIDLLKTAQILK